MYETLITHYQTPLYFSTEMANDLHIDPIKFQEIWRPTNDPRTIGKISFEEILEYIAKENGVYIFEAITNQYLPNYKIFKDNLNRVGDIKFVQCNYSQYSSKYGKYKKNNHRLYGRSNRQIFLK